MKLDKNDLDRIAVGRFNRPYLKYFILAMAFGVIWAFCSLITASEKTGLLHAGIAIFPFVIMLVWAIVLAIKEVRYVKKFITANSYLIGKEI
jgi:hypothetical protein